MTATGTRPVVRSQVEPRIVERRRTVLEAHRRRRRRRWVALAVVVVALLGAIGVALSPLMQVDRVQVVGAERLDPTELATATGIVSGDRMVTVDLAEARRQLRDLPMVAAATVTREWPRTVRVAVVEEEPLVVVRSGELRLPVSRTGRVLPAGLDGVDALPELQVPEVDLDEGAPLPEELQSALLVYERMPEGLRSELSVGRLDPDGQLEFALADDASVHFGAVRDIPAKLAAAEAALAQVERTCLAVLDVREPSRPTASRIEGCAVPAPTDVQPEAQPDATAGDR